MRKRLALLTAGGSALLALAGCDVRDSANGNEAADGAASAPEATGPAAAPEAPAPAEQKPAIAQSDSENGDFRLAVTEASRSNGVLTIKANVTLVAGETGSRTILSPSQGDDPYLVSGDQKYMMLADNDGVPLTTADGFDPRFSRLGDSNAWWAKFPAPAPEVKSVGLYFRGFLPIENIPITDR